jgi:hypothetical protein
MTRASANLPFTLSIHGRMLSDHALSEAVSIHKNQEQDWLARCLNGRALLYLPASNLPPFALTCSDFINSTATTHIASYSRRRSDGAAAARLGHPGDADERVAN